MNLGDIKRSNQGQCVFILLYYKLCIIRQRGCQAIRPQILIICDLGIHLWLWATEMPIRPLLLSLVSIKFTKSDYSLFSDIFGLQPWCPD